MAWLGLNLGLPMGSVSGASVFPHWILTGGHWADAGVWIDSAVWVD